jgi:hypothetical protein
MSDGRGRSAAVMMCIVTVTHNSFSFMHALLSLRWTQRSKSKTLAAAAVREDILEAVERFKKEFGSR